MFSIEFVWKVAIALTRLVLFVLDRMGSHEQFIQLLLDHAALRVLFIVFLLNSGFRVSRIHLAANFLHGIHIGGR